MDGPAISGPSISSHASKFGAPDQNGAADGEFIKASTKPVFAGMEGGVGEFSYVRNSGVQYQAIDFLKPVLEQAISELECDDGAPRSSNSNSRSTIPVADFGCSSGANTIHYAEIIFQAVLKEWSSTHVREADSPPFVQYHFCDLPSNDFNTLFRQLEDWRTLADSDQKSRITSFCAAAVPGSFYKRLLPPGSLRIAISVLAVHWLSQIPAAVVDKASPAYNKGCVWIDNAENPAAFEAFAQAGRQDLRNFFLARAEEVVSGGVVVLYAIGREDDDDLNLGVDHTAHIQRLWDGGPLNRVFAASWQDLVDEGIIDEETRDSFNLPVYWHSLSEVREIVESTNAFDIKRLELHRRSFFPPEEEEAFLAEPERYGQVARNFARSLVNSYVIDHIGKSSAEALFDRLEKNATTEAREKRVSRLFLDFILAVLIRK